MKAKIENMQKIANDLYKEQGLTDEVLDLQLEINKLRHKHDITDTSKQIHEEFVQ